MMNHNHLRSTYLTYLPPVLWTQDGQTADFIAQFLLIFEKLLTGVDDGQEIVFKGREQPDFETVIDRLHWLYNPWRTRTDFLSYLASWVALKPDPAWDEYQLRKLIGEIVTIYRLRGLKAGLRKYLEIHVVTEARPRVVIDDGDAIHRLVLEDGVPRSFQPLAGGHPLLHPDAMAIDNAGDFIIADHGDEGLVPPAGNGPVPARLWRYTSTGEPGFTTSMPPTLSAVHEGAPLYSPTGVVVEASGAYAVVDVGPDVPPNSPPTSGIYRFAPPGFSPPVPIISQATTPSLPALHPVDMVQLSDRRFAVLDRGARFPNPAAARIITVSEGPPLSVTIYPLANVSEPSCLTLGPSDRLIVADAGIGPGGALLTPEIYVVNISVNPPAVTSLLVGVPNNPLIYPSAVVMEDAQHILVTDIGAKPRGRYAKLAEPPALYRIPLPPAAATITPVLVDEGMVWPSDIELSQGGEIVILDYGESQDQAPARSWRALDHEFGVIVYFSDNRPAQLHEKQKIIGNITRIVDAEKPAHSHWTLKNNQL